MPQIQNLRPKVRVFAFMAQTSRVFPWQLFPKKYYLYPQNVLRTYAAPVAAHDIEIWHVQVAQPQMAVRQRVVRIMAPAAQTAATN